MDFELNSEQQDIKAAAREFAEGEFLEVAAGYDAREEYPFDLWKKACDLGFIGLFIDEKYGGSGLGLLEHLIALEEFCRVDPGCGYILLSTMGAEIIQAYGTEEQKARYVTPLARGDAIMGCAIAEAGIGMDSGDVCTNAVRDADAYVINGEKAFVSNGSIADYLIVLCVTNSSRNAQKKYSLFIVDTKLPGCDIFKIKGKIGLRASDTATVRLSNVRVPKERLIGERGGEGLDQIQPFLDSRRLIAAAASIGTAQGAMEHAISYVKQRRAFGMPVSAFQSTQLKIADMATYIEASRGLCHKAAWMVDHHKRDARLLSMAKWFAGETGIRVADEALQLHGGYGYITESAIEHFFRDATSVENYGGYKELEKISIGKEFIGSI